MKKLAVGILAHVDAGKTTLSEAMLYMGGSIRKMGRVDRGDAFLDTYELEKKRGITIFSKQAILEGYGDDPSRHSGARGFLGGDGTDPAGAGLRHSGDQRNGRSAGAYEDAVASSCQISGSHISLYQ